MSPDPTRLYQSLAGQYFAILGLGRSGMACARTLMDAGVVVDAWDDDERQRARGVAAGIRVRQPAWGSCVPDRLIVSPGIPHHHPAPHSLVAAARAAGVTIDNDIGLFFGSLAADCLAPPQVVAITGSNGKSTTAALVHHLLGASGRVARLAGNIGYPVAAITEVVKDEIVVLEVSSYQCELAVCLDPDIAVFLNFSPDHLERHGGLAGYFAAKQRLFEGQGLGAAVIGLDESEGQMLAAATASRIGTRRVIGFGGTEQTNPGMVLRCHDDHLFLARAGGRVDLARCPGLRGHHNVLNAAAALAVLDVLGLPLDNAASCLATFPGLPHRSQHVGNYGGITVINDSKATNAASALQSLRACRDIRWIVGGRAKEDGIAAIRDRLAEVRKAYLIGESATAFARELGPTPYEICETMDRAVTAAVRDAAPGETILLAPAAASFDQYQDFEARGDDFVAQVRTCFAAGGTGSASRTGAESKNRVD